MSMAKPVGKRGGGSRWVKEGVGGDGAKRRQQQPASHAEQQQPGKKQRRQHKSILDDDVYEAQDSDPDEVKHSIRYDVSPLTPT